MMARLFLLFLCCLSRAAWADSGQIQVQNAWIQAVPPIAEVTVAYMTIRNLTPSSVRLIGASSPAAARVEPMITSRHQQNGQEIMGMESVQFLEIPSRGFLDLRPGGNHLMMIGLTSHLKEGEHVKLTVRFAPGDQRIDVEVPVFKQEPK